MLFDLTLSPNCTSIGSFSFAYQMGCSEVRLPESITSIGSYAFDSCSALTRIELGKNITSIGGSAFSSRLSELVLWATVPPTI